MSTWLEVRAVLERYLAASDNDDRPAMAECFTEDAALTYATHDLVGGTALVDWLRGEGWRGPGMTKHTLGNMQILRDGSTVQVASHSVVTVAVPAETGYAVTVRGVRDEDELVQTADGWKICRRTQTPLWQYSVDGEGLTDIAVVLSIAG